MGELWSSNQKVLGAHIDPPKLNFPVDYIFAVKGAASSNFYHARTLNCLSVGLVVPGSLRLGSAEYFLFFFFIFIYFTTRSPSTIGQSL